MISLNDIRAILNSPDPKLTEDLAQESARLTRQYFGRAVSLYAPLYLSNYCSSYCTYCGFHNRNRIRRMKLTFEQMETEMRKLAQFRVENILLLTGESYDATPLDYLSTATRLAKKYFTSISLEIFPLETVEYRHLYEAGVDGITIYQETYDHLRYAQVHLAGRKKDYDFRHAAPERIAASGIRQLALGILLGLADVAEDLFALFEHLRFLGRRYPGVEYSLSFPRLQSIKGKTPGENFIDDITFIKTICLARLSFPRVGINLSTRESPALRDRALELGVTRISAGSSTAVGGYDVFAGEEQDPQFDVHDTRSVAEVISGLKARDFDPVLTDWRTIPNS